MSEQQPNKVHRKSKEKKERPAGSQNPRAFTFANAGRFQRQAAYAHDAREKRLHVPLVDRLPDEAPPLVVAVVGPPQVGKTTLIKSLIRRYTKQTLSAPTGPLTVVTSKRRRLTFMECPADSLASMIDIAKVVDIVLLMIDGKYGFEMETMEFLNVLSASGMPGNVFGILTKLDLFKSQETLRAQKKRLKHRFWSELYQGAKLFYLSGVVNGRYPDREILNLSRFLSVMKNPRPLIWRNSHPYCLADRFEDMTAPQDIEKNPKCDRTIALYGYLRGTNFPAQGARVHIPGAGDLNVLNVESRPDPCPTPYQKLAKEKATGKTTRKRLDEKQRIIYAPMSDVGGVLVDKDRVYIDVKSATFDPDADDIAERGLGEQLVMGLQGDRRLLGEGNGGVRLFNDNALVNGADDVPLLGNERGRRRFGGEDDAMGIDDGDFDEDEDDLANGQLNNGESDDEVNGGLDGEQIDQDKPRSRLKQISVYDEDDQEGEELAFADSDSDIGSISSGDAPDLAEDDGDMDDMSDMSDEDGALKWKTNLAENADALNRGKPVRRTVDLARLMYDLSLTPVDVIRKWNGESINGQLMNGVNGHDEAEEDDDFFKQKLDEDAEDRMVPRYDYTQLEQKWTDPDNTRALRARFARSRPNGDEAGDDENHDEDRSTFGSSNGDEDDDEDEGDGEFEDLETGETHSGVNDVSNGTKHETQLSTTLEAEREKNAKRKEELKLRFESEDKEGFANSTTANKNSGPSGGDADAEFGEDEWYDLQKSRIQKQLDINRAEFDAMDDFSRVRVEGHRAGTYARIVLENVPYEFAAHFNPRMPIIVGGLNPTEERFAFVQVRIKRHRWHQKILKTNDPLIFSMGWRRFQSLPVYSISDSRTRNRLLKYTPEHMHCFGTFYGPLIAPNTGFCAVQSFSNKNSGFRIAATGVVLSVDEGTEIVKKLKLKGYPHKIYKNTAIIKDMFSSDLEIAKFKAGNLRTVSGVRGMIKGRAGHQYPEGYIRAGFEDKILMSDIVFLSAWRFIKPRKFYMPVTNLLMPPPPTTNDNGAITEATEAENTTKPDAWNGMRLTGELRALANIPVPSNRDSTYRPVVRPERHFNPLRVPRKLQADLPFKSQIMAMKPQRKETYLQKRAVVLGGEEKRARDLMQKLMTVRNEKVAKRAEAQEKRREGYRRKVEEGLEKKRSREKREKDEYWRKEGKKRGREEDGGGVGGRGGGGKRRKQAAED